MKKTAITVLLVLLSGIYAYAVDFSADYIDGILDVKEDGQWYEVYIGDFLPQDSVVRLDSDSYAELSYGRSTIKLTRPGVYQLNKLVDSKSEIAASGNSSFFTGKFRTFIQDDQGKTQTTVGGVRAAEAETVSVEWMSSETAELIADGIEALSSNSYDDAESYFTDAYDFAADYYEEGEALYYLGLTAAMKGNYSEALNNLDSADVESDAEYYSDFYLLKGQLLIESFAYDEAFDFLNGYNFSSVSADNNIKQEIYFMLAVAGNNTGNKRAAEDALTKLIRIDSSSDTAKAAKGYRSKI